MMHDFCCIFFLFSGLCDSAMRDDVHSTRNWLSEEKKIFYFIANLRRSGKMIENMIFL